MTQSDTVPADVGIETPKAALRKLKHLRQAAAENNLSITTDKRRYGLLLTVYDDGKPIDRIKARRLSKRHGTFRLTVKSVLPYDKSFKPFVRSLMGETSAKGGFRVKWNADPVRLDLSDLLELLVALRDDRLGLQTALDAFFLEQLEAAELTPETLGSLTRKERKAKLKTLDAEAILQAFASSAVFDVIDDGAVGRFVDRVAYADAPDERPLDNAPDQDDGEARKA